MSTVHVSVPVYALGSRIDFHFPRGVAVIQLPFEALGEAEEDRQRAFCLLAHYWGVARWRHTLEGLYEGDIELEPVEIRDIEALADTLADRQAA